MIRTSEPTLIADGLGFTEGPAKLSPTRLAVASNSDGAVHLLDGDERTTITIGAGATGIAVNRGELYVVHNCGLWGAPSDVAAGVTRIDGDGSPELLVHERLGAPNDVCIGPDGDLYFTDPVTDRGLREPIEGTVYRYGISDGTLEPLVTDRLFPNGLAFGPSGEELFVAESFAQRIVFFRPGEVQSEPRLFCELPDGQPDGICFDLEGRLWVCVPDAEIVVVLAPDGSVVHRVPCPKGSFPTNCCFAGDGDATLVITASMLGGVLAVETDTAGQPLYRSVDGP